MNLIERTKRHVRHFTVTGYVTNIKRTKILMVYHNKLAAWLPPGGHLELNEVPHEGAIREVFEETGMVAQVVVGKEPTLDLAGFTDAQIPRPYAMTYQVIPANSKQAEHIHLDMIYHLQANELDQIKLQPREVLAVRWMTREEVLAADDTFDSVKGFVRAELQ